MSSACGEESSAAGGLGGEIMLFGVRLKVDPMRKSVSLNNLSQYEQPNATNIISNNNNNGGDNNESSKVADEGYASADDAAQHLSNSGRERKRGVPWTEEEHKLFLLGLQKVGKGDWRGISRNFVKTRTPTQVASHAQKYFIRRNNHNRRRRRRSSLFDITTDSVSVMSIEEGENKQETAVVAPPTLPTAETAKTNAFPVAPVAGPILLPAQNDMSRGVPSLFQRDQGNSSMLVRPVPMISTPNRSTVIDLNANQNSKVEPSSLSLRLSLSLDQGQTSSTRLQAFKVMSSFSNGESIISVA